MDWDDIQFGEVHKKVPIREWQLEGLPALARFSELVAADGEFAEVCRQFLLSFYEGLSRDFDLARLRELPPALQEDALKVIRLDWCGHALHTYLPHGHTHLDVWLGEDITHLEPQ